jgi:hypothetical protein
LKCDGGEYDTDEIYFENLDDVYKDYQSPLCNITFKDYIPGT